MKRSAMSCLILLTISFAAANSRATDIRPVGGEGGESYRLTCGPSAFLVGVSGATGDWVDRLQIVCSVWNGSALGHPQVAPAEVGASRGGIPNNAYCPGGAAVAGLTPHFTEKRGEYVGFLDDLYLRCADIASGDRDPGPAYYVSLRTRGQGNFDSIGWRAPDCPEGELAVGIHGRAGLFIDSIGLICGPVTGGSAPGIAIGRAKGPAARAIGRAANSQVASPDAPRASSPPDAPIAATQPSSTLQNSAVRPNIPLPHDGAVQSPATAPPIPPVVAPRSPHTSDTATATTPRPIRSVNPRVRAPVQPGPQPR